MIEDLITAAARSVAFGVVGVGLMVAGFFLVDLLTPGRLRELIWTKRSSNAALLLTSNQLGIAAIVFTAIFTNGSLPATILFGLVGIALMALAFFVLDWLTPGKLGELFAESEPHPAAKVVAASHFGAALIVCACIA